MKLHPQVIEKGGKSEFVVLPFKEYLAVREALSDYEDLRDLKKAKAQAQAKGEKGVPLKKAVADLGAV